MTRISNRLKQLVVEEATKLKEFADKSELKRLDLETLNPDSYQSCIYGQMTGNCSNSRSLRLLNLCTIPYSTTLTKYTRTRSKKFLDGSREPWSDHFLFSPIEYYIYYSKDNKNLVNFLKGKKKTLTIEDL